MKFEPDSEIRQKLKHLRAQTGLSTRDLARKTGFSQAKISKLENGTRPASADDVEIILSALDVRPSIQRTMIRQLRSSQDDKRFDIGRLVFLQEFSELDAQADEVLTVDQVAIPLWLQSPQYTAYTYKLWNPPEGFTEFMRNKERRKAESENGRRQNVCVLHESLLFSPSLPRAQWLEELHFIQARMKKPGIEVVIVPDTDAHTRSIGSWWLLGKQAVLYEPTQAPAVLVTDAKRTVDRHDDFNRLINRGLQGSDALQSVRSAIKYFAR